MRKLIWTDQMIKALSELFPVETTAYTASRLNMSEKTIKRMAKDLGLTKIAKSKWMERADYIQNNFNVRSFSEMANELGITKRSVSRIASKLGLKRTKEQQRRVSSRIRQELIRKERRHIIFGLDPVSRIKVVSNRARVRLRSKLKSNGYIVGNECNTLYYLDELERLHKLELRGIKLGLRFFCFYDGDTATIYNSLNSK